MIFYFSGTGNSLWVAKQLSLALDETIISISEELNSRKNDFTYNLKQNEKIIFVFPVHSWGPTTLVLKFISKIKLSAYYNQSVFFVCTCGDNCGYTNKIISKALKKKSIFLSNGFSIQMPNNYILMSGFDTDSKELEQNKLQEAPHLLNKVITSIKNKNKDNLYNRGNLPILKSYIIYPIFKKFIIGKNLFYAKETCTSCNLCIKTCPTQNIYLKEGRPKWQNSCIQCVSCIHRCPNQSIEYGKITQLKGRYCHPNISK